MAGIELWGGIECTVNRVGTGYRDQCRLSGHHERAGDLELFAGLGLKALRYPVLWERVAPEEGGEPDWRWSDERLGRIRDLGMRPIAGLVHHGSGPAHTDLLSDSFAPGLGRYAGRVARRYPWIADWTPVNEPLTTARFSALYGHWYPHARDDRSFWRALLNQVDGVRLAMRAVRQVNPAARLIQTDDLGRSHATDAVAEQAAFDNLRRWAGWDLLFGRVDARHPLWEELSRCGFGDRLRTIADDPCPPDIIGVNHYLTSDRFLDHRVDRYPEESRGGNGRAAYADVAAVRVLDPPPGGLEGALRDAWQRYATPLAVTEVHNGCTREEQLRWAAEAWDTAVRLRDEGVDLRAVTAWSLLGSRGWNTLLTANGVYELGLYDVTTGTPRKTALATLWKGLPARAARHPVVREPGWWRRPGRLIYDPSTTALSPRASRGRSSPPLLICGATGTLGQAFARACAARGIAHRLIGRETIDFADREGGMAALAELKPWGVVNAAGWVRVDDAEEDEQACHRVNAFGAIWLAQACARAGIPYVGFSSDLVFDGASDRAYLEADPPRPLGAYGRSKAAMEAGCAASSTALIVRTAAFFSPHDRYNFAVAVCRALAAGGSFAAAEDYRVTPAYLPQLVDASLDLLLDDENGIWHLANRDPVSWAEFARRIAQACGHDERRIEAVPGATLGWRAPRPRFAALGSTRGTGLGPLDHAIERFAAERPRLRAVCSTSS